MTYDQVWWPILGICALHLTHPKCTQTAVNIHTPWTHTRSSGQPFMLRCPGSSWGFGVLLKGTSVVVLKEERALYIHSPHLQSLPARDSNSQPFDYESDSLTIRPRLPHLRYGKVVNGIYFAVSQSIIYLESGTGKRKNVPWWSEECSKAIKERNKAFTFLKRTLTPEAVTDYQKKRAYVKKVIKIWRQHDKASVIQ